MTTTAAVTTREVTLSHGKTRYLEAGTGHPVILLHGASVMGGADDYRVAIPFLSQRFRVLAPDFIGWPPGDIRDNPTVDAFPDMTEVVREFQDAVGLRSSHIVGATMGGWIAGLFAYESPNRVDKLVMTGNPGFHGAANARLASFEVPSEEKVRQALAPMMTAASSSEFDALVQEKVRKLNEPGYADAYGDMMKTMADGANRKRFNLLRRLPHIEVPTLFLIGRGDPTSQKVDELTALLPGSSLYIIETGAHQVHYENAEEFSKAVTDFLA